ncbi:MAG: endonuclease/exonuclease/phosphatase family protein [Candidatus Nanoarchaeia archaeon]|nr:endonuclease/exonuclease/phosphatase family protein [Candidatus Nanoarchaeia archaeon]MDD5357943.1 endonuclease/exonuclease/phosphatase family protein [Candidatus Nanoarchaeia archaeon]MDD5588862.1 endonuclease/exonuclease/phosphatase family protein [Candidatus Nanoarchaeia archaeon]
MANKEIKIMNYNILHGFHNDAEAPVLDKERLQSAQKVVEEENPDILILTEACFAEKNKYGIKMDYPKLFNFPYHFHAAGNWEWGSSILSKFPIISSENYSMDKRNFSKNELDVNGQKVYVDVAHPYPDLSEFEKRRFFYSQLRDIKKPYILAGDFNALSDDDKYNREKLLSGYGGFMKNKGLAKKVVDDLLTYQTIPEIRKHGLIDTYTSSYDDNDYTMPTKYILPENKNSRIRTDYIFCSPDFIVNDARIIKNKYTNKASDHYPIVANLKLKNSKK